MAAVIFENIHKECLRIEEDVLYSGKSHCNAAVIWTWVHYIIGVPMTVLAAWAGIDAFSDTPELSGYLALITAALAALQTFLGASDKASEHKSAGSKYFTLRNQTRLFREVELSEIEKEEAIEKIRSLSNDRDELNSLSPSIPYLAFFLARKGIEGGEAQHKVDEEE
ncbi:MAG: SLATT domain-containing protein [Alphaproteobacteria bacterium]